MTDRKFTDEEVIKALECCGSGYKGDVAERCMGCPLDKCGDANCFDTLLHDLSLDLINRQKAEIAYWMDAAANAKKEAINEFAERLKKYYGNLNSNTAAGLVEYHIDQIKEEMLCEK